MKYDLLLKGYPYILLCSTQQQLTKPKKKYEALEMEEFVILHQIPNQKKIVFSIQVVSGDTNLTFSFLPNSLLIIYLLFNIR